MKSRMDIVLYDIIILLAKCRKFKGLEIPIRKMCYISHTISGTSETLCNWIDTDV